jgi:hypothetical protein
MCFVIGKDMMRSKRAGPRQVDEEPDRSLDELDRLFVVGTVGEVDVGVVRPDPLVGVESLDQRMLAAPTWHHPERLQIGLRGHRQQRGRKHVAPFANVVRREPSQEQRHKQALLDLRQVLVDGVVPQHLEVHHGQRVAVVVIGHHLAGHSVVLSLLYGRDDGRVELPIAFGVLHDRLTELLAEELRHIARAVLRGVGARLRDPAGHAQHGATGPSVSPLLAPGPPPYPCPPVPNPALMPFVSAWLLPRTLSVTLPASLLVMSRS